MADHHTPAALNIAQIIMNGRDRIDTLHGAKSLEGIADLVDGETQAPRLYEALQRAEFVIGYASMTHYERDALAEDIEFVEKTLESLEE